MTPLSQRKTPQGDPVRSTVNATTVARVPMRQSPDAHFQVAVEASSVVDGARCASPFRIYSAPAGARGL
jgi:hypothetical protein